MSIPKRIRNIALKMVRGDSGVTGVRRT